MEKTAPAATAAEVALADADLTGKTIGDFRVLRRLGQGGMGQVYLAEQTSLKRNVALKIMRSELAASPTALERFRREAEAVARVTHANIVQVHAFGAANGLHYMALEYVDGKNLREYLAKKGPPDLLLALSIMRQAAAALGCAAESGIVHRDIKPENILLTRKGEVKVADFGLSRGFGDAQGANLTQTGITMGTPLYMSPEQVQGKDVDPRTDIYSLGVSCYHMLAGEPPFRGQSAIEVAIQHVQNQPMPLEQLRPDLPIELCQIVHKMMAKAPDQRFPTARELLKALVQLRERIDGNVGKTQDFQITQSQPFLPLASSAKLPLPPAGTSWRQTLLYAGLGVSLAVALASGVGLRLLRERPRESVATVTPPNEPTRKPPGPDSREIALREAFQKPYDPRVPEAVRHHGEAAIDLGTFYLERRRLEDAETYFQKLRERPAGPDQKMCQALGKVGHALVLAFRGKAKESNDLLLAIERERQPELFVLSHPRLRPLLHEALQHNAVNIQPASLPDSLERLRRAAVHVPRPGHLGAAPK